MAKEELIGNKCPLCGYRLAPEDMDEDIIETGDEELTWMLTQNLQRTLLTWLMDLGGSRPTCRLPDCLTHRFSAAYSSGVIRAVKENAVVLPLFAGMVSCSQIRGLW